MSYYQNLSRIQKTKFILLIAYLIFNLVILIVSFQLNLNDIRFLVNISRMIPYAKYVAMLGMLLFLGLILVHNIELRRARAELERNTKEIHVLKSRLYDLDEKEKAAAGAPDSKEPEKK